jgi:transmembrane sensor
MLWPVATKIQFVPTDSGSGTPPPSRKQPRKDTNDRPSSQTLARTLAVLAAVAITTGSASLFVGDTPAFEYYSTRVGEQRPLPLKDGSIITLNTDSQVKMRHDGQTLYVRILRGEVYFNMLRDPQRRLIVSIGDRLNVIDVATIFDIRLIDSEGARITVQEGQVQLSAAQLADVQLHQNQQAIVDSGPGQLAIRTRTLSSMGIDRQLSWLHGYLSFKCESLSNVAKEFNRYNRTQIEVKDLPTSQVQIGGSFSTSDPGTFAKGVAEASPNVRLKSVPGPDGTNTLQLQQATHSNLPNLIPPSCTADSSVD